MASRPVETVETVEVLIVLTPGSQRIDDNDWAARGVVLRSRFPPRIFVVAGSRNAVTRLSTPSVKVLRRGDSEIPEGLSESEKLFASAWLTGLDAKKRPGDGKAWDQAGFLPPDRPC